MRIPLQTYGFSLNTERPILDLRNAVEGTEDILYFLTLRHHSSTAGGRSIRVIDDRDDGPIITFPRVSAGETLFERLPVRGPVAVAINTLAAIFSTAFTGHVELEGPDYPTFFIPLATQVFEEVGTGRLVCRIEASVNLSLFIHSPDVASKCLLRFVPDEPSDLPVLPVQIAGPSDPTDHGFVQVFDRMPVFGPGRVEVDIDSVNGGPIAIYGFLSD